MYHGISVWNAECGKYCVALVFVAASINLEEMIIPSQRLWFTFLSFVLPALICEGVEAQKGGRKQHINLDSKVPSWLKSELQTARNDIAFGLFMPNKLASSSFLQIISQW
jgi:hypothetical protein